MRFNETVHWYDGLFLQQHHLQTLERTHAEERRSERSLSLPCPEGFIDLDVNAEAINAKRVVLRSFSCIMPDGTELSHPGNTVATPLELSEEDEGLDHVMVYLAMPQWTSDEANVVESGTSSGRLWSVAQRSVRDENTGGGEVPVMMRRYNTRIVTERQLSPNDLALPLMRLVRVAKNTDGARLVIDKSYMPPFVLVTESCPLLSMTSELMFEIKSRRNKIQSEIEMSQYDPEKLTDLNLLRVLQLRSLNHFEASVSPLLYPGRVTPLNLYREMRILLGELAALQPLIKSEEVPSYIHADALPEFDLLFARIRALILSEGGATYRKIEFKPVREDAVEAALSDEDFMGAEGWYLAVASQRNQQEMVGDVEQGDNFRLLSSRIMSSRVRGFKLTEVRYPPAYLPVLSGHVWFRIETSQTPRMWREVPESKSLVIDYAHQAYPQLHAVLYITITEKGGGK